MSKSCYLHSKMVIFVPISTTLYQNLDQRFRVPNILDLVLNYCYDYQKDWNDGKSVAAVQKNCVVTKWFEIRRRIACFFLSVEETFIILHISGAHLIMSSVRVRKCFIHISRQIPDFDRVRIFWWTVLFFSTQIHILVRVR